MGWVNTFFPFLAGFLIGIGVAFIFRLFHSKASYQIAREMLNETESQRRENLEAITSNIKDIFGNLSLDALSKSTEEFLKLAKEKFESEREISTKDMEAKKGLIDEQLKRMASEFENISLLVKELERDRVNKFGELSNQLKNTNEQTTSLMKTTNALREAFASSKYRGQWGERMAEDVLRICGFIENINYQKQRTIEGIGTRPDFTFFLPKDHKLNMDVKFPLDNYLKYLDETSPHQKMTLLNNFFKDVKARIKEVTTREYINPEQNTLDYVLLFIPNEQVYTFINEQDSSIIDLGMKMRVIICSPFTLFAILAVIRQAVENFALEQTSNEILSLLGAFRKQWETFTKKMEVLGNRIRDSLKEYEILTSTRRRQLDRPLNKIEELRKARHIPLKQFPEEAQGRIEMDTEE